MAGVEKMRLFLNEEPGELEDDVNQWLETHGDSIQIIDRQFGMSELDEGYRTYSAVIWYREVPVAKRPSAEDFQQDGRDSAQRHYPKHLTDPEKIEAYVRRTTGSTCLDMSSRESYITNFVAGYLDQVQEYQPATQQETVYTAQQAFKGIEMGLSPEETAREVKAGRF